MVQYRRSLISGATFFFTVNLHNRTKHYLSDHVDELRKAFIKVQQASPFQIDAIVILPDHLHTIWTLPENDYQFSSRWRRIKRYFTSALIKKGIPLKKNRLNEYNLWQRRYWEHVIRDEKDFESHVDYIHYNPVKHGYAGSVKEWPYSSFHRYVERGVLDENWGDGIPDWTILFGEPPEKKIIK